MKKTTGDEGSAARLRPSGGEDETGDDAEGGGPALRVSEREPVVDGVVQDWDAVERIWRSARARQPDPGARRAVLFVEKSHNPAVKRHQSCERARGLGAGKRPRNS